MLMPGGACSAHELHEVCFAAADAQRVRAPSALRLTPSSVTIARKTGRVVATAIMPGAACASTSRLVEQLVRILGENPVVLGLQASDGPGA